MYSRVNRTIEVTIKIRIREELVQESLDLDHEFFRPVCSQE